MTTLLIGMPTSAAAPDTMTGSIAGQVQDPQGLSIPGATVTVTSPPGAQTLVSE